MINTTLHLAFYIKHTGTYENGKQTRCGKMKNNMEKILLLVLLSWYTHLVIDKNGGFYYDNEKGLTISLLIFSLIVSLFAPVGSADAKQAKKQK